MGRPQGCAPTKMKTEIKKKYWLDPSSDCRNCGYLMPEGANYCPSCSQRNTTGKINVFEFLKSFLEHYSVLLFLEN